MKQVPNQTGTSLPIPPTRRPWWWRIKVSLTNVYTRKVRAMWTVVALVTGGIVSFAAQTHIRYSVEIVGTFDLSLAAEVLVALGTMALATVTYLSNLQTRRFQAASVRPALVPGAASEVGPEVFEAPAMSHGPVLFIENAGVGPAQDVTLYLEAPDADSSSALNKTTVHANPPSETQGWRIISRVHRPVILPGRRERWVIDSPVSSAVAAEISNSALLAEYETIRVRAVCYDGARHRIDGKPTVYRRTPPSPGRNLFAVWEQME